MSPEERAVLEDFSRRHGLQVLHVSPGGAGMDSKNFFCAGPDILLHAFSYRMEWHAYLATPGNPMQWFGIHLIYDFLKIDDPGFDLRMESHLAGLDTHWDRIATTIREWWPFFSWHSNNVRARLERRSSDSET